MRAWHLAIVFVLALIGFGLAALPLSAALQWSGADRSGLSYARATGTLWNGTLENAVLGQIALGDVTVETRPLDLLLGRLGMDWRFNGPGLGGQGDLLLSPWQRVTLLDTRLAGNLADLPLVVPLSGTLGLDIDRLTVGPEGCTAVVARVAADPKVHYGEEQSWTSPPLDGVAACTDGVLHVPVSGTRGGDTVSIDLRIAPDRTYDVQLGVKSGERRITDALELIGFRRGAGGRLEYQDQGALGR